MFLVRFIVFLSPLWLLDVCDAVGHVTLYRSLPDESRTPVKFNIRSTFQGSVSFVEATDFAILINVSAPSVEQLSTIKHSYKTYNEQVLLQVFQGGAADPDATLSNLLLFVLLACFISLLATGIAIHCWHKKRKFNINLATAGPSLRDESRAPLMDQPETVNSLPNGSVPGRSATSSSTTTSKSSQQSSLKNKKKKKKRPSFNSGESSTEEEDIPRPIRKPIVNEVPRRGRKEVIVVKHPALTRCQEKPTIAPCASVEGTGVSSGDEAKSSVSGYGTTAMADTLNTSGERAPLNDFPERKRASGNSSQDDTEWNIPPPPLPEPISNEHDEDRHSDFGAPFTLQLQQNSLPRKVDTKLSTFSPLKPNRVSQGDEEDWPLPPPDGFQSDIFSPKSLQNLTRPLQSGDGESVSTRSSTNSSAVTVVEAGKVGVNDRRASRGDSPDSPLDDGYETAITHGHSNELEPENNNKKGTARHHGKHNGGAPNSHLAMISVLSAVICLASGVYSQSVVSPPQVHITVFLPAGFAVNSGSEVYLNANASAEFTNKVPDFDAKVYDVKNAYLSSTSEPSNCTNCEQGCDQQTGRCVCTRGFRLYSGNKCTDTLECLMIPCDKNARCENTHGSYRCTCKKGFYGDGKICSACQNTCPTGHFRARPCPDKLCQECKEFCPPESYITSYCDEAEDILCTACEAKCTPDKFEFSPCTNHTDRECKSKDLLSSGKPSANVVVEDRRLLHRDNVFSVYYSHSTVKSGQYHIKRGTGLEISITMEKLNILPSFSVVNHSLDTENDGFNMTLLKRYCPYPIPDMYQLTVVRHNDKTSAYVDPMEAYTAEVKPCVTYKKFGSVPSSNDRTRKSSFFSLQATPLTDKFGLSDALNSAKTILVEPLPQCARDNANCDACVKTCSTRITRKRDGWCGLSTNGSDERQSTRLKMCFDCCVETNCTYICRNYNKGDCLPVRCRRGSIAEFVLRPIPPYEKTKFTCHVQPLLSEYWYKFSYDISYKQKALNKMKSVARIHKMDHIVTRRSREGIFELELRTGLDRIPDVVKGRTDKNGSDGLPIMEAGLYSPQGTPISSGTMSGSSVYVRPLKPFSVNTQSWKQEGSSEEKIANLTISDSLGDSGVFDRIPRLKIKFDKTYEGKLPRYKIRSSDQTPRLTITVRRNESVLEHMYGKANLVESNVVASISRDFDKWSIQVSAMIESCPGFVHLQLHDDTYPTEPIYNYDLGIDCPKEFTMQFSIPTTRKMSFERRFTLSLRDSKKVVVKKLLWKPSVSKEEYKIVAGKWRKSSNWIKNKYAGESSKKTESSSEEINISLTFIVSVCGFVLLFVILWTLGYLSMEDAYPLPSESKLKWGVLLTLFYSVFWTAYSLLMTFTVFILLWGAINRESFMKLSQYPAYASTVDSLQRLDLYNLQQYVSQEMQRQNDVSNANKERCQLFMGKLQELALQARYNLSKMAITSDVPEQKIRDAFEMAQASVADFKAQTEGFRDKFNSYAENIAKKVVLDIQQTAYDIETNRWLTEPRTLRNAVWQMRKRQDAPATAFLDWLGIEAKVENLKADFTLKNFPLPNRSEFEMPPLAPVTLPTQDILSSFKLPKSSIHIQVTGTTQQPPMSGLKDAVFKKPNSLDSKPKLSLFTWASVLTCAVVLDLVWLLHRFARCVKTVEKFLCGWPCLVDCRHQTEDGDREEKKQCCSSLRRVYHQVMKTDFIPKFLATAFISCLVALAVTSVNVVVNMKTLHQVGYFDTMTRPIDLSFQAAFTVVESHSQRINQIDNRLYTNMYKTHLQYYHALRLNIHSKLNCKESGKCPVALPYEGASDDCNMETLSPRAIVIPRLVTSEHAETLVQPYLDAFKTIVTATCNQLLVYLGILVLVNLASSVGSMYIQRFRGIRQKVVYVVEKQVQAVPTHIQFEAQ